MINELKYKYSFLFRPFSKAQKRKRVIWLSIVIPFWLLLTTLLFLSTQNSSNEDFKKKVEAMALLAIFPLIFIALMMFRVSHSVNSKDIALRLAMGMSKRGYIVGVQLPLLFFMGLFYTEYGIALAISDPQHVKTWILSILLFIAFYSLLSSLSFYILTITRNIFSILILSMVILALSIILSTNEPIFNINDPKIFWAFKVTDQWSKSDTNMLITFSVIMTLTCIVNHGILPTASFFGWMDQAVDTRYYNIQMKLLDFISRFNK